MVDKTKIKKGKVYISTNKGLFPIDILKKQETEVSSKRLKEGRKWLMENGLVSPPYDPNSFLTYYESNSVFFSCVNQIAQDVAGLGYILQLKEEKKENKTELEKLQTFLGNVNLEDSFRCIIKQLLIDWGSVGWFGLEVVRNNKKEVAKIYHIPAHTIRVHESQEKYCQIRNNKKVWFKKFGSSKDISSKDGTEGKYSLETRASELIFYKNFYPKSDYYGIPNIIAAIGDVVGLISARDYNLAFFQNYGVPSAIIIISGEWEEDSAENIKKFLDTEIKGTENAHRTLVVEPPERGEFEHIPLVTEVKEASFRLYRQDLKENILMAYSMPPERIGIRIVGKLGGNVAEEATKIYIQAVIEPLQEDLEDIINEKLLVSETYKFKFNDIDIRDLELLVKRLGYQIERAMLTPNEARNALGHKPYPEGNKFYMAANLIEVGAPEEEMTKAEKEFLEKQDEEV